KRPPAGGRLPHAHDRFRRHADAVLRRRAGTRAGVGPGLLRAVIEPRRNEVIRMISVLLTALLGWRIALAAEAPIWGAVKSVDTVAQTVTIESTAKGKTRQVIVYLKPGARVVKFVRSTDPAKPGFVEQAVPLTDGKHGLLASVAPKHEGVKESAD